MTLTSDAVEAIERAITMLSVVGRFVDQNPVGDYTVFYDGAMCDGLCLAHDCRIARRELERVLEQGKGCSA